MTTNEEMLTNREMLIDMIKMVDYKYIDEMDKDITQVYPWIKKLHEKLFEDLEEKKKEIKEYEAVEKFMLNKNDRDERLKAHYREGKVVEGVWLNDVEEEEEEKPKKKTVQLTQEEIEYCELHDKYHYTKEDITYDVPYEFEITLPIDLRHCFDSERENPIFKDQKEANEFGGKVADYLETMILENEDYITLEDQLEQAFKEVVYEHNNDTEYDMLGADEKKEHGHADVEYYCNYEERKDQDFIMVAGGGLENGNAYANVEEIKGKYYYHEYGDNPEIKYLGTNLVYDDKSNPWNFRVY